MQLKNEGHQPRAALENHSFCTRMLEWQSVVRWWAWSINLIRMLFNPSSASVHAYLQPAMTGNTAWNEFSPLESHYPSIAWQQLLQLRNVFAHMMYRFLWTNVLVQLNTKSHESRRWVQTDDLVKQIITSCCQLWPLLPSANRCSNRTGSYPLG